MLASICGLTGPTSQPILAGAKPFCLQLVWLAVMFAPLTAKMFVELPNAVAIPWMIGWAFLSYIFAPYGMWKAQRKK